MKTYPCPLAANKMCRDGGNKLYDYGFTNGTASYCRYVNKWLSMLTVCPLTDRSESARVALLLEIERRTREA